MYRTMGSTHRNPAFRCAWAIGIAFALLVVPGAHPALAAATGKIQGRLVATDTGEPLGFADVRLIPADTALRPVGTMANADGTFLIEVAPGRYALELRALSYARKRVEGILIEAGRLLPFDTGLAPEALQQPEIVVDARARQNTEGAILATRRRAVTVGDAISAEQVRRSPDRDAAEVLRRVTGLTVSSGKFVFVRGLGERYSSTEVDGVRIASPEQNKRVVPLDLFPASLLENITIQKTYTADRPGEFGGGDVQVRTKDFPGRRTWSYSVSQGWAEGTTFQHLRTYAGSRADLFGFGSDARRIPDAVFDLAGGAQLREGSPARGFFTRSTLAAVGRSFSNIWSPTRTRAIPNASYSAAYGDEFKLFGRPLGMIESWSVSRSFDQTDASERFFPNADDTLYDYAVNRSRETVQLGNVTGISYRLSPRHTLHARAIWTHSADDEVRVYEGTDHNQVDGTTGTWLVHRDTRLMYVERDVLSGTAGGQHEFAGLFGTRFDWNLSRSRAKRQQPDRRETSYSYHPYDDGTGHLVDSWTGSVGRREYGDLRDVDRGVTVSATTPFRLGRLGRGRTVAGFSRQDKDRDNFYRRFNFYANANADPTAPPEVLFGPEAFDGKPGSGYVDEATLSQDNYVAQQRVAAGFLSVEVPMGSSLRTTLGLRVERGTQDVRSFDLFNPSRVTAQGGFANTDWLPSGNLTWSATTAINVRIAASRTLSRPDLNELSPSPALEYIGGFQQAGNPQLRRALLDNYDVRVEAFPSPTEVMAVGAFHKRLEEPIEQVLEPSTPLTLKPYNSEKGFSRGMELEARASLGRLWRRLTGLTLNTNGSFITSRVRPRAQLISYGTKEHPLQGQANNVLNAGLGCTSRAGKVDAAVLLSRVGRRLNALGLKSIGDVYEQPMTTLDVTLNLQFFPGARLRMAAKNLLDRETRLLQGGREVSHSHTGRSYSLGCSFGS